MRLKSQVSAGGHNNLLSDVMLPGLAHLVSLIEQTRSAASNTTHSTISSTTPSPEATTLAFCTYPAKSPVASPSLVSAVTSTPEDMITASTASPKTITLAFRSHQISSSTSSAPVSSSAEPPFQFLSLPHDVKIRTLSFVPETDVALSCRLVCREFRDLVDGNELQIAQLMAEREHDRLRSQIDMRRQMMPRNLTAFAFDACLWVSCAASASLIPKSQ
jgi:hypothetical protein